MKALDPHVLHCWSKRKRSAQDVKSQGLWPPSRHAFLFHVSVLTASPTVGDRQIRKSKANQPPTAMPESFQVSLVARWYVVASRHAIHERYRNKKPFQISMWLFYSWQWALTGFLEINNKRHVKLVSQKMLSPPKPACFSGFKSVSSQTSYICKIHSQG